MTSLTSACAPLSVDRPEHRASFHFGLAWTPLIGSHPARMARRRAAAARASHYIYCGERGVALALAHLSTSARRWRQFSAASVFAACHPVGAVVWTTTLPDGRFWLVGARDGAVLTRTDRLFDTWSDMQAVIDQMVDNYPGLRVLAAQDGLPFDLRPGPEEKEGAPFDFLARLTHLALDTAPMQRLSWPRRMPLRGWLALLVIAAGCTIGLNKRFYAPAPPVRSDSNVHEVSEAQRQTQLALAVQTQWSGAESYVEVVTSLRALPVVLDGWRIVGAHCDWSTSVWSCQADYRRDTLTATNRGLLEQVPQGWLVTFTPLSTAHLTWVLSDRAAQLAIISFPEPAWVDAVLVSALQARAPAFAHITLGARVDLHDNFPPPSTGATELSDALSLPGRRSLALSGPLRSYGLLDDLNGHVAWVQAVMDFQQGITPGLSRSALQLNLKGWIHEK